MKLKQIPSDFIVEEIPINEFSDEKQEHTVFLLEKKELDTFEALNILSSKLHIPLREIGFAGLKDKHAYTKQYISIPTKYRVESFSQKNLWLKLVGYSNRKIKTGELKGNRFTITVRGIREEKIPVVYRRVEELKNSGVPNYFDSQRFGSVIHGEFIAKYLINRDCENAVKIFLTHYLKSERKQVKDEKRKIKSNWGNLEGIDIKNPVFKRIIKRYLETRSWCEAYSEIPSRIREMHINAYQSFLWNECLKEVLKKQVDHSKLYPVKYNIGTLLFYTDLTREELEGIPRVFPTISDSMKLNSYEEEIINKVLSRENLVLSDFDISGYTKNFFKTRERECILYPGDFSISEPMKDEINTSRPFKKLVLSYTLPKGCYATIVTKKLFGH